MKTAILIIWILNGITSQVVPAEYCEHLAEQAMQDGGFTVTRIQAKCLYTVSDDGESK